MPKGPRLIDGVALSRSRNLRSVPPDAEKKLWNLLRARRFHGSKFRRQFCIDRFIVDFACVEQRLVVELDGGQHFDRSALDEARTAVLIHQGYRVIRFWNDEILRDPDSVLERISEALKQSS